ncbi:tRNA wybutosine-synthesizing protein 3-like protein [Lachnellula hyalina]|uniref:tRNA(Phe) 7-[(3-amino-3-carboxypropyl)-4-demethylwyosine(37)-N(4)]-methyltransferase n=1 Tax=Lachnellula hyalina TaxID=1316788 RepID=A0A8H8R3E9_9HELO|nr:tRNA wybutosine-synthesizing protein 3-like protein [Lachnellula hyalina]TVY26990.1 tRNA wybutosine-synthesizing protein 3-like protein [Lachnellula hyalina]
MTPPLLIPPPPSFLAKKTRILSQLAVPDSQYDDLSPKGSIDEGIRDLIAEINGIEGCVTTSSCAGRVSVFLEGKKDSSSVSVSAVEERNGSEIEGEGREEGNDDDDDDDDIGERGTKAGIGGKGGGGRWLFVSHDPVSIDKGRDLAGYLGMERRKGDGDEELGVGMEAREVRFVHFKFEPMILHILTSSLQQAQNVLSAALQAGFRESGALNLVAAGEQATPMVGVRSMGLALESIIGYEEGGSGICMVPEAQLGMLLRVGNERFVENGRRIARFRGLLKEREGEVKGGEKGERG